MKTKIFFVLLLCLFVAVGCASPPKTQGGRTTLPSQTKDTVKPQPPPQEKLEELVIPQREEAKKVPERLYSFFARDANVQDILLAFSKESEFNIVLDPELSGKVTIDLKRVTLTEALDAILPPLGWTYQMEGKFIKVSRPKMETRLFTLNYVATKRSGKREIYASTGGGLQTGALAGQMAAVSMGQQPVIGSAGNRTGYSDLTSVDEMDLWKEIQKGLETIIFGSAEEKGKEVSSETDKTTWTRADDKGRKLIVNKSSGVIMVNDYPLGLNKVASYIETVEGSSQRQVSIQAKILEVILSDGYKEGINWQVIESLPRMTNMAWGLTDKAGTRGFPGGTSGFLGGTDSTTGTGGTTFTIPTPGIFKIGPYGGILALGAAGTEVLLSELMQSQHKGMSKSYPAPRSPPLIIRRRLSGSETKMSSSSQEPWPLRPL